MLYDMATLVVVDAWDHCEREDLEQFPYLEKQMHSFGAYLNTCLDVIRKEEHAKVVHLKNGRMLMPEINWEGEMRIDHIEDLPMDDFTYFCGFHIGICIKKAMDRLGRPNSGLVVNLSNLFPTHAWDQDSKIKQHKNFLWSAKQGFEPAQIRIGDT